MAWIYLRTLLLLEHLAVLIMKRLHKSCEVYTRTALGRRPSTLPLSVSLCPMHFRTKNRWFVCRHYWRFVIELDHIPFIVHGAILSAVLGHPTRMNFHWRVENMISFMPYSAWSTCMQLVKMASNNRKASIVSTRWIIYHTFSMFDTLIFTIPAGRYHLWSQTNLFSQMAPPTARQNPSKTRSQ